MILSGVGWAMPTVGWFWWALPTLRVVPKSNISPITQLPISSN